VLGLLCEETFPGESHMCRRWQVDISGREKVDQGETAPCLAFLFRRMVAALTTDLVEDS
jgi:hypothetical protein